MFVGYGVNKKGYRCFDPVHRRMYTTMDCEFFKQSYYYTNPGPYGEIIHDDLSWLINPVQINIEAPEDPKELVGETTKVISEDIVPPPQPIPALPIENQVPNEVLGTPEVIYEDPSNIVDNHHTNVQNRYELPPRST